MNCSCVSPGFRVNSEMLLIIGRTLSRGSSTARDGSLPPSSHFVEESTMADLMPAIAVKPLTLHIGAEISGVDLGRPLDVATRKAINDALLRWKVVFFRGQHLGHRSHVEFARQMGEPTIGHA